MTKFQDQTNLTSLYESIVFGRVLNEESPSTPLSDRDREAIEEIKKAISAIQDSDVFFSRIIASMQKIPSRRGSTMSTDGKNLFFNPDFVHELIGYKGLNESVQAIIVHEILHIAFKHHIAFAKELKEAQDKNNKKHHKLINIACDLAINSFLVGRRGWPDGFYVPGQGNEEPYRSFPVGKDARWYYNKIIEYYKNNPKEQDQPNQPDGQGGEQSPEQGQDQGAGQSGEQQDQKELTVGSKVRINKTGEVGQITRINPDNTYEVDIINESYTREELTPIGEDEGQGDQGDQDGQEGDQDGQGDQGGQEGDQGDQGDQGGQEGGQSGQGDQEDGDGEGQGGQGQGGQGEDDGSEGGETGGTGGPTSSDEIEDILPDDLVDGVPDEKTPGDIEAPQFDEGKDFDKQLEEEEAQLDQDLKDFHREKKKSDQLRNQRGVGSRGGAYAGIDYDDAFKEQSKIPWQQIISEFLSQRDRGERSYRRPSRRMGGLSFSDYYSDKDEIVMPSRFEQTLNELILIVDVSGSNVQAASKIFPELVSIINSSGFGNKSSLRLVSFNTKVEDEYVFTFQPKVYQSLKDPNQKVPDEKIIVPQGNELVKESDKDRFQWNVGGGTRIAPVFDALSKLKEKPPFVVIITDGEFYGGDAELAQKGISGVDIIWIMTVDNGIEYQGKKTYKTYEMDY